MPSRTSSSSSRISATSTSRTFPANSCMTPTHRCHASAKSCSSAAMLRRLSCMRRCAARTGWANCWWTVVMVSRQQGGVGTGRAAVRSPRSRSRRRSDSVRVPSDKLDALIEPGGRTGHQSGAAQPGRPRCRHHVPAGAGRRGGTPDRRTPRHRAHRPHDADRRHVQPVQAVGARSVGRTAQADRTGHRGRRDRAGQDGDRSAGRSAGPPDPKLHRSWHRIARRTQPRRASRPSAPSR